MPWYLETMSPMGHWSPQLWTDRPSVQTIHGTDYLRSTGGHSPRVRAVQEVPGHLAGAGLKAVQAALSPDRVEVEVAAALKGAVECGEGHNCPSGPHGACCGHPTSQADPVTLTYRNWRGEVSDRTITPRRVWFGSTEWHPEPQWLLTAWDAGKDAERDFALADFLGRPGEREALVAATLERAAEKADAAMKKYAEAAYSKDNADGRAQNAAKCYCAGEIGDTIRSLATPAQTDALAKLIREAEIRGQIKAGGVFATSGAEERWVQDGENACHACGGSGHKDDAAEALDAMGRAARAEGMRKAAEITDQWREGNPLDAFSEGHQEAANCIHDAILAAAEKEARHG